MIFVLEGKSAFIINSNGSVEGVIDDFDDFNFDKEVNENDLPIYSEAVGK